MRPTLPTLGADVDIVSLRAGAPTHVAWIGEAASTAQQAIYAFFLVALVAAVLLMGVVFVVTTWWSIRYREDKEVARDLRETPSLRRRAIVTYTVVPAVVVLALGALSFQVLVEMHPEPEGTFHVGVVGEQWAWNFVYDDGTTTTGELFLPVDEVVVFRVTTEDVIHSFSVPALGVKIDALPGHENVYTVRTIETGSFAVYCAEYCGLHHARMRATVHVLGAGEPVPPAAAGTG